MTDAGLDDLLHRWSAWVENGCVVHTRQQVTHFLKVRSTKVAGSHSPQLDCTEMIVEQAVSLLATAQPSHAKVVRAEYNIKNQRLPQLEKALLLRLSLRTYQRHLKMAKTFIAEKLSETSRTI